MSRSKIVDSQNERLGLKNPICLSLDVNDFESAKSFLEKIKGHFGCIKIGPRLFLREGKSVVGAIQKYAPVFLDFKFNDIPSTTLEAARSAFDVGATFVTVHASVGGKALEELAKLEKELSAQRPFKILAVTVLTSFSEDDIPSIWNPKPIPTLIRDLAKEVIDSGLTGVVCSPHEAALLRLEFPTAYLVTPGVRWGQASKGDQSRVSSPVDAINAGSNLLVIGRPFLESADPNLALTEVLRSLN